MVHSGQGQIPVKVTLTGVVRNALSKLMDNYATAAGLGPDAYCLEPIAHPMADGKYLSTLAQMKAADLLGDSRFASLAVAPLKRLASNCCPLGEHGVGWGLGFL